MQQIFDILIDRECNSLQIQPLTDPKTVKYNLNYLKPYSFKDKNHLNLY